MFNIHAASSTGSYKGDSMKKKHLLVLGTIGLVLVSCAPNTSSGNEGVASQGGRPSFETLDADANGSVSFEEFSASLAARGSGGPDPSEVFSRLDSDGSGDLNRDEVANAPQRP